YPAVSLSEARQRREGAKKLLATGIDPAQKARVEKINRLASSARTFEAIADEFLAKSEREGKADATLAKKRWLVGLAESDFGKRPIAEITAIEILASLRKVESKGNYET